jgi:two-component system chemotaxis response regulator CheY
MADQDMKILVADDLAAMRISIRNMLQLLGFTNIVLVEDGVDALEKLREGNFDFVIADINMPKMTGLELLEQIKADVSLKDIPVLFITAESEKENIIQAIQTGVNNYILKPFTVAVLQQKIDELFPE